MKQIKINQFNKILGSITLVFVLFTIAIVSGTVTITDIGIEYTPSYSATQIDLTGGVNLIKLTAYNATARPAINWYNENGSVMMNLQCHNQNDNGDMHNHCKIYTANQTTGNPQLMGRMDWEFGTPNTRINFFSNPVLNLGWGNITYVNWYEGNYTTLYGDKAKDYALVLHGDVVIDTGDKLKFNDGDTYIKETSDDVLAINTTTLNVKGILNLYQPTNAKGLYINSLGTTASNYVLYALGGSGSDIARLEYTSSHYFKLANPTDATAMSVFYNNYNSGTVTTPTVLIKNDNSGSNTAPLSIHNDGSGIDIDLSQTGLGNKCKTGKYGIYRNATSIYVCENGVATDLAP